MLVRARHTVHHCCNDAVLCYVVPPHILKHLADTATDRQLQQSATQALQQRKQIQQQRNVAPRTQAATPTAAPSPAKKRTIFDSEGTVNLQTTLVRQEGGLPVSDKAVNEAYDYSGATWDMLKEIFNRNSIDGAGMELISTVHHRNKYNNAFWNGEQMAYGDGDGVLFQNFTSCIDVIGHELTHGVTQYTADLRYQSQSGALNESISDVFGSLLKQRIRNQTADQADWLIGEGLLVPKAGAKRTALRSMAAPGTAYDDPTENGLGTDPQPDHMSRYADLPIDDDNDWGGVHINSGIPNKAFYLVAKELGGYAWERAGKIWYEALTGGNLTKDATFSDMQAVTVAIAIQSFGENIASVVSEAWAEVGVEAETS